MRELRRLFTRLFNFAARRRGDERLREEIESHLTAQTAENIRTGMDPAEAPRQARLKLGAVEAVRENYHAEEGLPFVEDLLMDVRYAFRVLRKSPTFTVVASVTLMLVIGTNVVVLGVLNAVLLRPLEVSDPQNLYQIRNTPKMSGGLLTTSYPAFEDFRQRNRTLSAMAAIYGYSEAAMRWGNAVMRVRGYEVTGNYFDLLGTQPQIGRFFDQADEHGPNSVPYVVLSDHLWRNAFQADRGIVGATVKFNEHPFTVIGVASARFHGTERFEWPDYWLPIMNQGQVEGQDFLHSRASTSVTVMVRPKPGVTLPQATEDLNAIAGRLAVEYPKTDKGMSIRLIRPGLFGDDGEVISAFLYSVTVLSLLLLAAACANLASLFAARAADRSRELALRAALGSGRLRLVRQLLTEAILVSLLGGTAGLVGAELLLAVLNRWNPSFGYGGQRLRLSVEVDAHIYVAALALTLGCGLLFGLIPARQAWQSSPLRMMKSGPVDSTRLRRFALRDLLLGSQIATCTLLVTASLVAIRGTVRVLDGPLGIKPQGAILAEIDLHQVGQGNDVTLEKEKALLEAARNIPGVTAVGAVRSPPLSGGMRGIPVYRPGTTEFTANNSVLATRVYPMSPGYLEAAGTRLLRGRDVAWQDTPKSPSVAIVNETFARKMWGETPAIGQRFLLLGRLTEIVGVAEDGKYHDLMESPQTAVYLPLAQSPASDVVFVVRSRLPANEVESALRRTFGSIEPNAPLALRSWPDALGSVLFPARAATGVLGLMGVLAAMLAVTGIFGMAAYCVSRRTKELGIRMALGARKSQVMIAAVGRPTMLLGAGSAVGLLAAIAASPLLGRLVYQANPSNPAVLIGVILTMALIGVAGSAIPARRALAVDPSRLMRED